MRLLIVQISRQCEFTDYANTQMHTVISNANSKNCSQQGVKLLLGVQPGLSRDVYSHSCGAGETVTVAWHVRDGGRP